MRHCVFLFGYIIDVSEELVTEPAHRVIAKLLSSPNKASSSWSDVRKQTCFNVNTPLQTQTKPSFPLSYSMKVFLSVQLSQSLEKFLRVATGDTLMCSELNRVTVNLKARSNFSPASSSSNNIDCNSQNVKVFYWCSFILLLNYASVSMRG